MEHFGSYLLCNEEESFRILEEFVELKNVWVIKLFENADLAEQLLPLAFFKKLFVDDLDRTESICLF